MSVTLLSNSAILPKRGSEFAAGLDLYSPVSGTIEPSQRLLVPLDISIELPKGTFGHILPRSGLALKNGIHVGAGVIDEDYRGNVGVLLFNLGNVPFVFKEGDRIAQLVIKSYENINLVQKEKLDDSSRGNGGFGSTGV
jgi:dUTP pyrophosphatase